MLKQLQDMIQYRKFNGLLFYSILWVLTLDYQDKDFKQLLDLKFPQTLHHFTTLTSLIDEIKKEKDNKDICFTPDLLLSNWNIRYLPSSEKLLKLISSGKITIREIKGLLNNQECLKEYIESLGNEFNIPENIIVIYHNSIKIIKEKLKTCQVYNKNYQIPDKNVLKSYTFRIISDYCNKLHDLLILGTFSSGHDLHKRRPDLIMDRDRYDLFSPLDIYGWNSYIQTFIKKEFETFQQYYSSDNNIRKIIEQMEMEKRISGYLQLISLNQSGEFHSKILKTYLDVLIIGIIHGLPPLKYNILKYLQLTLSKMKCPNDDYCERLLTPFLNIIGHLYSINGELFEDNDNQFIPPGEGYTHQMMAGETVTFIRKLLQEPSWKESCRILFTKILTESNDVINNYLKNKKIDKQLTCLFGVLSILGGFSEVYRVGGKALYKRTKEIGYIISYDPYINDIGLLFSDNYADEVYHYNINNVSVCNTINPPTITDIICDIDILFKFIQQILNINSYNKDYTRENLFIIHSLKEKVIKIISLQSKLNKFSSELINNDIIIDYLINETSGSSYIPILSVENREMLINQLHQQITELSNEKTLLNPNESSIKCSSTEMLIATTLHKSLKGFSLNECIKALQNNNDDKLQAVSDLLNLVLVTQTEKDEEEKEEIISQFFEMLTREVGIPDHISKILIEMVENDQSKLQQMLTLLLLNMLDYNENENTDRIEYSHVYNEKDLWFNYCVDSLDIKFKHNYDNYYNINFSSLPEEGKINEGLVVSLTSQDNNNKVYAEKTGRILHETNAKEDVIVVFYDPITGMKWKESFKYDLLKVSTMKDKNVVCKQAIISQSIAYISSLERSYSQSILLNLLTNSKSYEKLITKITNPSEYFNELFSRVMIDKVMKNDLENTTFETNLFQNLFLWNNNKEFINTFYDMHIKQIMKHIQDNDYNHSTDNYEIRESLHPLPLPCSYTSKVKLSGAKRLIVLFDLKTDLGAVNSAKLIIADNEDFYSATTYNGNSHILPPRIIEGNTVYYKFICSLPVWGFRFEVRELPVNKWTTEDDINDKPNRSWGLWLCESLFNSKMHDIYKNREINIQVYFIL